MSGRVTRAYSIADTVRRRVDLGRLRECLHRLRGNLAWAEREVRDARNYAKADGVTETPLADRADLKSVERSVKDAERLVLDLIERTRPDSPENGPEAALSASDGKEADQ